VATSFGDNLITRIYEWAPLHRFIAGALNIERLYPMEDPLARLNVMEYRPGEALNWHFDRSRYTTTLLLQSAEQGGEFEYRTGLRSDDDQNYDGVGRFLTGEDSACHINTLEAGTLNVFAGKNTLHRVSTVAAATDRGWSPCFLITIDPTSSSARRNVSGFTAARPLGFRSQQTES
jgi:hypothetical protein